MVLSKSFGYALRGILYVSLLQDEKRNISLDEMAGQLSVPRHFLGKIMKAVVKEGILSSVRGPQGGFYVNETTLDTPLLKIILLTEGKGYLDACMLGLRKCNSANPCPLHDKLKAAKDNYLELYRQTTIGMMLRNNKPEFIRSISI
jgi:Rrf2 family transcriptional regulator, iron-sulfur cluster assembly transcription factor